MKNPMRMFLCFGVLTLISTPAFANHIDKKVSGQGQFNVAGCPGPSVNPCVNFNPNLVTNTATWENFLFDGSVDGNYDVFKIPTTQSATFQLNSLVPNYGSFLCGFDTTMFANMSGFCSNILDSEDPNNYVTFTTNGTKVTLTFNSTPGDLPPTWAFFADVSTNPVLLTGGGGSSVPEPTTLALLGFGLAAAGLKKRFRPQT
jgi:PEP-CTERM motif